MQHWERLTRNSKILAATQMVRMPFGIYLAELPRAKTVGFFQASDIFKVKEVLGDTMCIIGGMPNSLLHNGTVVEVQDYTRKLCEVVGKGGGYIMGTCVGELSESKPELVKTWVEATKKYGVY